MKQYKLIETYPGSPKLGKIATFYREVGMYCVDNNAYYSKEYIENNPKFWQVIIENAYEIISIRVGKDGKPSDSYKDGKYLWTGAPLIGYRTIDELELEWPDHEIIIHSVKRMSDGEIFTIGDTVKYNGECQYSPFSIDNFFLSSVNTILVRSYENQIVELLRDVVKSKSYEILSFKIPGNDHWFANLQHNGMYGGWSEDHALNQLSKGIWSIHSVKRLSDYEVFTIGDKLIDTTNLNSGSFTLKEIEFECAPADKGTGKLTFVHDHHPGLGKWINLENLKKVTPVFTTYDGVSVFTGDTYHSVLINHLAYRGPFVCRAAASGWVSYTNPRTCKTFSTKESAESYILLNKPCLSVNEMLPVFGKYIQDNSALALTKLANELTEIVKNNIKK